MTATLVQALPEGPGWMYEVKLDGYRALILKSGGRAKIRSRNDKNLSGAYPGVDVAASRLNIDSVVLDGEIVALDAKGRPSFQALQHRAAHPRHSVVYYAFDVLQLNGVDLTRLPLDQRKAQLPGIVKESGLRISQELPGTAQQVIAAVQRLGLEGVIAKRRDSRYDAGMRSGAWVKLKLDKQQEFVIGGYRPGSHGVDALIVGYYEDKQLRYAGKVRAGFTPHIRREVFEALKPMHTAKMPVRGSAEQQDVTLGRRESQLTRWTKCSGSNHNSWRRSASSSSPLKDICDMRRSSGCAATRMRGK